MLAALALGFSFSGCDPRTWVTCWFGLCGYALDDVPPERPRGLVATPGNQTVTLSWSAGEPELRYEVGRATTPGGPYLPQNSSAPGLIDNYMLVNGTPYYYVVTARDEAGNVSPRSLEVTATPRPDPPPPPLPAPQLSISRFFDDLQLQWTDVPGARSYKLYRSTVSGGSYALLTESSAGFFFDEDVQGGTRYYYVIAAVDALGHEGVRSAEVSDSPAALPGPNLGFRLTWGTRGQNAGSFWEPRGIATDPSGNVYVTDNPPEIARVQKFTPAGAFVTAWTVGASAHGVAVGPDGSVFVVNRFQNRVQKYTSAGAFVSQWGTTGSGQGNFSGPTGIAVDGAGNVYVADSGNARIQKFTAAGTFVRAWAVAGVGVATDSAGDVYVVDRAGNRVRKFNPDGAPAFEWGEPGAGNSEFAAPEGIGVDVAGRVFVTDTGNDRIQVFSASGVLYLPFGSSGTGNSSYDGPNAVASDCAANLYILDAGNSRVQKLGPGGETPCPALGPPAPAFAAAAMAQQRPGFSATLKTTSSTAGARSTTASGLARERGAGAVGRFSGRLAGRATRSTRAFRAFSRGTWKARYDISMNPRTGAGTAKGVVLATPAQRKAGRLCLGFQLKIATVRGKVTITGSFSTLAGPGSVRGTFSQTLGKDAGFTLRGAGAPGRSVRRALPARCRL